MKFLPVLSAALLMLLFFACGSEEEVAPDATVAPTGASQTPTSTPAGPIASSTPDIRGWPAYSDASFGYSFRYPAGWHLAPSKPDTRVTTLYSYDPASPPGSSAGAPVPEDQLKLEIAVLDNPQGLALRDWIAADRAAGGPVDIVSEIDIVIDGAQGLLQHVGLAEGSAKQIFLPWNGSVVVLSAYPADSLRAENLSAILTTFRLG